ncbi:hypothetical protein A2866_03305 [Candidatus Roizmanbacteria bacterium RIFCSPHIGHO2_01_FULL_39_8]|uniref:UPF0102 protein A2866_03305 n=3 Tax=Candidatus Roizmaniibacteriota TaxID=1752723 RepID=A0A1F7GSW1_9BACT|nr:MAG: hypothetical protein A2866_03305 [Candidatus Roizmanbacteria bacterium RIFCSPHIGHO2_01_FULL_39_8]OGK28185.1 MAG: hypothetical protein A3C28_01355 [Candidatus Roizmanbacteria bacterium RIFCSPHIGHO2_02_FULL_39_9]OGK36136.1 MAG: hypothetical protein A3F60_02110 [Candidatus Roizmanbacteria bacterium RIFCSPHIGHO2_12_FULL_39_8]
MNTNRNVGKVGENLALTFLKNKGYSLISRNYYTRWGEIDLIVEKDTKISFIEVKTRISTIQGKPYESVDQRKLFKLTRPIKHFLLQDRYKNRKLSLDVISIELNRDQSLRELKYFENVEINS